MERILVVEDDRHINDLICLTLQKAGWHTVPVMDGEAAADLLEQAMAAPAGEGAEGPFDLVLLDVMLPGADGFTLMEYIDTVAVPVIFITAKNALEDRVRGLRLGADDYIVKPFEPPELVARVEALLRRVGKGSARLAAFDVEVDIAAREVRQNGVPVALTPYEYELLVQLMRARGQAFYRDVLFERVWGGEMPDGNRTLDLHILRLRQKLGWQDRIKTVYKIGYMLEKG